MSRAQTDPVSEVRRKQAGRQAMPLPAVLFDLLDAEMLYVVFGAAWGVFRLGAGDVGEQLLGSLAPLSSRLLPLRGASCCYLL